MKFTFTDKKDTRSGFGAGLHELGKANANVVALCADLTGSLKMRKFVWYGAEIVGEIAAGDSELRILIDYALDLDIDLNLAVLHIKTSPERPARVRYRGFGFRVYGQTQIQPLFDTARGYEFGLADPSLFRISEPVGHETNCNLKN